MSSIMIEIRNKVITSSDISLINSNDGSYVSVIGCQFNNLDISTLNKRLMIISCSFYNSEAIIPNPREQINNCIFKGSLGAKKNRYQIREALSVAGYAYN